jgi:class 3 adenylate cyclase
MPTHTPLRRKLAAILAADVVGYSKKMGANEERTLRNLKLCRAITDAAIAKNHGRIFHTAGDSVSRNLPAPWTLLSQQWSFKNSCTIETQAVTLLTSLNSGWV